MNDLMIRTLSRAILGVALLVLSAGAIADLKEAQDAYEKGNFSFAFKEFRKLAVKGDAVAQFGLGQMYHKGQGAPQDFRMAMLW